MSIREITRINRLIIAGHRGFASRYPENTLLSLQKAVEAGVDMVEFDIGLSKDNVPVLCHDPSLDRTTTGTGLVNSHSWRELSRLDAGFKKSPHFSGTPIPKFEEVCEWALGYPSLLLNIDLKRGDVALKAVDHVMKLVLRYGLQQRAVFNSGDKRVIDKIYEEYGFMLEGGENHFASGSPETGKRLDAVCLHIDRVASETVQKYVDMGKLVWCWGAEELEEINKAIDCGVTLLVCDNPTTCLDIVKERGIV